VKRLIGGGGVRISTLSVYTGKTVLATVDFGDAYGDKGLYIDDLFMSYGSFLEFDLSKSATCYVFTRYDYSSIINQIGFFDPKLGIRYGAIVQNWGNGTYCITMNEYEKWHPPMVPEPTTYGAGVMAAAVMAVRLRRRGI